MTRTQIKFRGKRWIVIADDEKVQHIERFDGAPLAPSSRTAMQITAKYYALRRAKGE